MFWEILGGYFLYLIQQNLILICVFAAMIGILVHNSTIGRRDVSSFRFVIIALFVMSLFDCFDHYIDTLGSTVSSALIMHRYVASLIAYMAKPIVPMLVAYGVCKTHRRFKKFLWIPEAFNVLIFSFNFFPQTRFYFIDETNTYMTVGPTGWLVMSGFIFGAIYVVHVLINAYLIFTDKKVGEIVAISGVSLGCLFGYVIESTFSVYNLGNQMTAVGVLFFYLFLVIKYTRLDPLTNLYNRQSFFANMASNRNVTGIISIDMNNLKYYNDTFGHIKGDEALAEIGYQIRTNLSKNMQAYRMGGDEFLVVCSNMSEEQIKIAVSKITFGVNKTTEFEIAIGYSYRANNDPFEYLIAAADESMYTQKQVMKKESLKFKKNLNMKK